MAIKNARGQVLFGGETVLSLGVLGDPRPGYWLATSRT